MGAADAAGELYAYGKGNVLFKPTKAREYQFRPTAEEAMSYFVGNDAVENGYKEDGGFAINGGKGFSDCVYKNISKVYKDKGDYVQAAAEAAGELYAYGKGNVLFKPTKAREYTFRPTVEEAMSYFVGNEAVENGYKEDGGFA